MFIICVLFSKYYYVIMYFNFFPFNSIEIFLVSIQKKNFFLIFFLISNKQNNKYIANKVIIQ
jgi:hypothetical protein